MVTAIPLENSFMSEAEFMVFKPQSNGNSTNNMVLQRALACLGLYYHYDIKAVSCEVFAMSMNKLKPKLENLQLDVLAPKKIRFNPPNENKYQEFYSQILARLKSLDTHRMLTLPYYLNWNGQDTLIQRIFEMGPDQTFHDLNKKPSWFKVSILPDYKQYEKTKDGSLLNKGLSFWERKFGYTWLEPESEDAPVQLELFLQEEVNKDPQKILDIKILFQFY